MAAAQIAQNQPLIDVANPTLADIAAAVANMPANTRSSAMHVLRDINGLVLNQNAMMRQMRDNCLFLGIILSGLAFILN